MEFKQCLKDAGCRDTKQCCGKMKTGEGTPIEGCIDKSKHKTTITSGNIKVSYLCNDDPAGAAKLASSAIAVLCIFYMVQ